MTHNYLLHEDCKHLTPLAQVSGADTGDISSNVAHALSAYWKSNDPVLIHSMIEHTLCRW